MFEPALVLIILGIVLSVIAIIILFKEKRP